jgi:hypothetical protein
LPQGRGRHEHFRGPYYKRDEHRVGAHAGALRSGLLPPAFIILILLLTSTATASAECAWVAWQDWTIMTRDGEPVSTKAARAFAAAAAASAHAFSDDLAAIMAHGGLPSGTVPIPILTLRARSEYPRTMCA